MLHGEIKFYHGDTIGPPIKFTVDNDAAREKLLCGLCSDPEVEGFEIAWEAPPPADSK